MYVKTGRTGNALKGPHSMKVIYALKICNNNEMKANTNDIQHTVLVKRMTKMTYKLGYLPVP